MTLSSRGQSLIKSFSTDITKENVKEMTNKALSYDESGIKESESNDLVNIRAIKQKKFAHLKFKFPIMRKLDHKNFSCEDSRRKQDHHEISNCKKPPGNPKKRTDEKPENIQKKRGEGGPSNKQTSAEQVLVNKEDFMKPFYKGWRRENVQRNVLVNSKRMSDIYYFAPCGKKLRSRIEIKKYLELKKETELTPENFTFSKFLIGAGEAYETQRFAAATRGPESGPTSRKPVKSSTSKTISKPSPKNSSPSIKSLSKSKKPNSGCLSVAPSVEQHKLPPVRRKRNLSIGPDDDSKGCHVKKKMNLRDRKSIQPPSRYELLKSNSSNESKSNSSKKIIHGSAEKQIEPEEILVEPDNLNYDLKDKELTSVESSLKSSEDSDLRLNFPFGIDESNDPSTTSSNTNSTKSLLSEGNLPPFATPVEKDDSKPDFPLIQLNFEDLCREDEGGGVSEDTNCKMKSFDPKYNPSKIRVRSMEELCDNTSAVAPQPHNFNPVTMNFNINANIQNCPPVYKPILPSIPTIPLGQNISYSNNGGPVSILLNIPNFSNNNNALVDNKNMVKRHIYFPANYITGNNNLNPMPLQNGTGNQNLLRILTPVGNSMIRPNFVGGKISNKKMQTHVPMSPASANYMVLRSKPPVVSPNARCTVNGETYELFIDSNKKPVLRPVSQNTNSKVL